jgi:hypothetical protein
MKMRDSLILVFFCIVLTSISTIAGDLNSPEELKKHVDAIIGDNILSDKAFAVTGMLGESIKAAIVKGLKSKKWTSPTRPGREAMDDYNVLIGYCVYSNSYEVTLALFDSIEFTFVSGGIAGREGLSQDLIHNRPGVRALVTDRPSWQVRRAAMEFIKKGDLVALSETGKQCLIRIWQSAIPSNAMGHELLNTERDSCDVNSEQGKTEAAHLAQFINLLNAVPPKPPEQR